MFVVFFFLLNLLTDATNIFSSIDESEYKNLRSKKFNSKIVKKSFDFVSKFSKKQRLDAVNLRELLIQDHFSVIKNKAIILEQLNKELIYIERFNSELKDLYNVDFGLDLYEKTSVSYPVSQNYTNLLILNAIKNIDQILLIIDDYKKFSNFFNGDVDFLSKNVLLPLEKGGPNKISILITMFAILKIKNPSNYQEFVSEFENKNSSLFYLYEMPYKKSFPRDSIFGFKKKNKNYFVHFHSGYSFGGALYTKNERKLKYTMPFDCALFIDYIAGLHSGKSEKGSIFTYDMINIYNFKIGNSFVDYRKMREYIQIYSDFFKKFKAFDIKYFNINDFKEGDIIFWRTFSSSKKTQDSLGSGGHIFIVLGSKDNKLYGLSYARNFDQYLLSGPFISSFSFDLIKEKNLKFGLFRSVDENFAENFLKIHVHKNTNKCFLKYNDHLIEGEISNKCNFNNLNSWKLIDTVFLKKESVDKFYTNLDKFVIEDINSWCFDKNSIYYNSMIKEGNKNCQIASNLSKNKAYEHFLLAKNKDDVLFINSGSKIEEGCSILISKSDMLKLLSFIDKKTKIKIFKN